ncbi:MAG: efflux RND transporter periplasmic adaptor subunit, partial [Patescibacteria group bacterium]
QNLYQVRTLMTTLSSALNYVVGESQANITAYKNDVNTGQININTAINTLDSQIQQISSQKATNNSTIATAENTLKSAQETLNLKQAGYTASQIANQKSAVKQAEANLLSQKAQTRQAEASVSSALAQFEKTILKSPIAGIITNKNSEVGEFIASTQTVFSVISEANYQIEANIPEIDVAKTKLGDEAVVTLDAYGSDREFKAKVINIDPSEKIIEGVPTYKTTFEFTENDNPAKPGMTANLEITTAFRENVISIPQRAVYETENGKTVKVLNSDNSTFREVIVTTGLQGSDGQIEIISGIQVGDKIITSVNTK